MPLPLYKDEAFRALGSTSAFATTVTQKDCMAANPEICIVGKGKDMRSICIYESLHSGKGGSCGMQNAIC